MTRIQNVVWALGGLLYTTTHSRRYGFWMGQVWLTALGKVK